jgi:hypothetical protein
LKHFLAQFIGAKYPNFIALCRNANVENYSRFISEKGMIRHDREGGFLRDICGIGEEDEAPDDEARVTAGKTSPHTPAGSLAPHGGGGSLPYPNRGTSPVLTG